MISYAISRHTLDVYATELRRQADAAKEIAARADVENRTGDAEHWEGRRAGLMEAHGLIMAVLTKGCPPIRPGDEVAFDWPDQAHPPLPNLDSHFDVIEVRDGMVGVKRVMHRPRAEMYGWVHHWAPLTAVHRVHLDGNLCPVPYPAAPAPASVGGA